MKKKILLAIPQLTGGGAERVVSVWANALCEQGNEVHVLAFCKLPDEYEVSREVQVHYIAASLDAYLKMPYMQRVRAVRRELKSIRPQYAISFLPAMQVWIMLASVGLGIKRIETIRINPWRISLTGRFQRLMWKLCYHSCYKIILQASDQKPFFSKRDQKKCVTIPNPISELYIQHYRTTLDTQPTTFVAAGRIDPQKNYKMMIEGFAKVCRKRPELNLRIFGTGTPQYMDEIAAYIEQLDMREHITLMGRTPHMEKEYAKSQVFLMTSDYEGLPNALMEAMASRLLCISTDCKTGPRDLIEDGVNGFLIPVGDAEALAECIEQVLQMSEEDRTLMAQAAREKILTYCSRENNTAALIKLFQ